MTRIYENRGFATRMNVSCVVIVVAMLFGCWELFSALQAPAGASTNILFGVLFFGGAAYAIKQLRDTAFDTVVALDADPGTRHSILTLWRPFSAKAIAGPLDLFTDWQFQTRGGRTRTPILTAHHRDHPRPLEFELRADGTISEELRAIAPEAIAAFERRLGKAA
jgi:hypothetical protein